LWYTYSISVFGALHIAQGCTIAQINVGTFGQVQVATYISSHIYLDKCTTLWYAQDIQYRSSMCIPQIDAEPTWLEPSGEIKYFLYRPYWVSSLDQDKKVPTYMHAGEQAWDW
jgi:hypothetical protein